ncbi:MAG TPA: hypothetical protein VFS27_06725 [Blastocatellia bacterium]|jgi:hypothetical protein|nr:hypothetical protein [Blastocatellia bacterium]
MRLFLISILLIACLTPRAESQNAAQAPQFSRAQLYRALVTNKNLDPDRFLTHLSHVCSLRVEGHWLPVVDIHEIVKGASVARGVRHIVILNSALKTLHQIEYTEERPLFCLGNRLWVDGDIPATRVYTGALVSLPNRDEGNVLIFKNRGRDISLDEMELNDVRLQPTRKRRDIQ